MLATRRRPRIDTEARSSPSFPLSRSSRQSPGSSPGNNGIPNGAAIAAFALQFFLFWDWIHLRDPSPATARPSRNERPLPRLLLLVRVVFVAAMVYVDIQAVGRWSRSLDAFQAEVDEAHGLARVANVLPADRREVIWGWTSSSLSLIVRRSV